MTRHFQWAEPGEDGVTPVVRTITDEEILASYYPYWCEQMRKAGKEAQLDPEECIFDFMVVHWAQELLL